MFERFERRMRELKESATAPKPPQQSQGAVRRMANRARAMSGSSSDDGGSPKGKRIKTPQESTKRRQAAPKTPPTRPQKR